MKPVHYSGMEGGVSFTCGQERVKGDRWSQYLDDVTCQKCKAWIEHEQRRSVTKMYAEADSLVTPDRTPEAR